MKFFTITIDDLHAELKPIYKLTLENPENPTPDDIVNTIKGTNKILVDHHVQYSDVIEDMVAELKNEDYIAKDQLVMKQFKINDILYSPGDIFSVFVLRYMIVLA